ncbi:putative ATP synthase subunit I [Gammaproteobacteria bacterium]
MISPELRYVLILQAAWLGVLAAAFFASGADGVLSAGFGAGIALGNTLLLINRGGWDLSRWLRRAPTGDVAAMYVGVVERIVWTLCTVVISIRRLELDPVGLLVGFGLTYGAYPLAYGWGLLKRADGKSGHELG